MKVADAITYCLQYHKINSRPNTLVKYKFLLGKFGKIYRDKDIDSILTKRSRYKTLSSFFNLIINTLQPELTNFCLSPAVKTLFHKPKITHWVIFDKDTINEAIFRTLNIRNRLILELMA